MNKLRNSVLIGVVIALIMTMVNPIPAKAHAEGLVVDKNLTCEGGTAWATITQVDDWDKLLPSRDVYANPGFWTWDGRDYVVVKFHAEILFPGDEQYSVIDKEETYRRPKCEDGEIPESKVTWQSFFVCHLSGISPIGLSYWGYAVNAKGELFLNKYEFKVGSTIPLVKGGKQVGVATVQERDGRYNCVVPKVVEEQTDEVCLEDNQFSVSAVNKNEIKIRLWCDPELWAWDSTGELVEHRILLPMKGAKVTVFHIKFSRPVSRVLIKSKYQTWSWPFAKKK